MIDHRKINPDVRYTAPGLERGLRLLSEFSHGESALTAAELARRLQLPRSTVFRLLSTLEGLGFVERAQHSHEFRLGTAVLRLGFEYLASLELTELGVPILDSLRDEIGYPCNLVVRDGSSIVYVAKSAVGTPFTSSVNVGTRLPAHATVLGRVLLEEMSISELFELYRTQELEVFSESTPRTVLQLFDMVQRDREGGYVVAEGFFEAQISTIAAPVRGANRKLVAAMGITIPSLQVATAELKRLAETLCVAANKLSSLLQNRAELFAESAGGETRSLCE